MAKETKKYTQVREACEERGWSIVTPTYQNLQTEMVFLCEEGHEVTSTWDKVRKFWLCPICQDNKYKNQDMTVIPKKEKTTRILAVDQATHTSGYAIFDNGQLIKHGVYVATSDNPVERNSLVENWLINMVNLWQPDLVALEDIHMQTTGHYKTMNVPTFKMLAQLQGVLLNALYRLKIETDVISSNTWRFEVGVKGRSRTDRKDSMKFIVKSKFDMSVSDDVADAIGIGMSAHMHYTPRGGMMEWGM